MAEHLLQTTGVFEITDYTTASDWERFIANIEEVLSEWKISKESNKGSVSKELRPGSISKGFWHERRDVVKFGNVLFDLRYQYLEEGERKKDGSPTSQDEGNPLEYHTNENPEPQTTDSEDYDSDSKDHQDDKIGLMIPVEEEKEHSEHELPENLPDCVRDLIESSNDFPSKAHCLVRWYNLRRFITLSPRGDTIISEDRVRLVLSSASIALANVDCHVPIFVQIRNPKDNFYQGISENQNIRTLYEMVFFRRGIKQYSYLSKLVSVFREKAGCNLSDPITVTIRLNYCLDSFEMFESPILQSRHQHVDEIQGKSVHSTSKPAETKGSTSRQRAQDLRADATFEQVVEALDNCLPYDSSILRYLFIAASWPPVSDKVITDTQVHSDLEPAEAPTWTIRLVTCDKFHIKPVHATQAINELFKAAVNYAYDELDATEIISDCDKGSLLRKCLELSYKLATQPEVVLSESPSDSLRKLVALIFHQAAEKRSERDPLDQLAGQVKRKPSLSEIYRNFSREHEPYVKEFIIRSQVSRPFVPISSPALPQRMFCTVRDDELRLCGAFTELCN